VARPRGQRTGHVRFGDERGLRGHAPERRDEARLAHVGGRIARRAVGIAVANRHRLYVALRVDDRLQERRLEREERRAVGRRAFRKDRDDVAERERGRGLAVDRVRVVPPVALDEQRADVGGQPADHGPAANLRLADEARRRECEQHEDVEPRDVVCDDQQVAGQAAFRNAVEARLDAQDAEQSGGPATNDLAAARETDEREYDVRRGDAFDDVESHPRGAGEAERQRDAARRRAPRETHHR